jgi:superkiller protein 3
VPERTPITIRLPLRYRFLLLVMPAAIAWLFVPVLIGSLYYQEAMALKEQVYLDSSAAALRRALSWQPQNALYQRELGHVYMAMSPWRPDGARWRSQAIVAYRRSVELNPWDSVTLFDLGLAEVAENQLGKAEQAFLSGLKVDPNDPAFYVLLGSVYGSQGKIAQARTALDRALVLSPDDQDAIHHELLLIDRSAPRVP